LPHRKRPVIGITMELSAKNEQALNYLNLAYAEAVEEAGGNAIFLPTLFSSKKLQEILSFTDGLVLTGGADIHPSYYGEEVSAPINLSPNQRTDFDLNLFRAALKAGKAILAICHGMQIMNVACGGSLYQDIDTQLPGPITHRAEEGQNPARHRVQVEPGTRLASVLQDLLEIEIISTHHQAVKTLGNGLKVSAKSPDNIIEGIEMPDFSKVIGIQWHPEKDLTSEASRRLFKGFIALARL
jgi:putative glutamine amidotransferase